MEKAKHKTLQNVFSLNGTKMEKTTRGTSINYNCNVFLFLLKEIEP